MQGPPCGYGAVGWGQLVCWGFGAAGGRVAPETRGYDSSGVCVLAPEVTEGVAGASEGGMYGLAFCTNQACLSLTWALEFDKLS